MVFENDILCFRLIIRGMGPNEIMSLAMVRYKDEKIVDRWVVSEVKQK